jgi:hypothetical protein
VSRLVRLVSRLGRSAAAAVAAALPACSSSLVNRLVLLRIPDFRHRDFRIFKPILKKGFSDPDLSDPNHQIPQKRSVTVVTIHAERINAQKSTTNCKEKICAKSRQNLRNFRPFLGAFYLATNIRILAVKIRIFFLPQKRVEESDLLIPISGSVTTLESFSQREPTH